MLILLLYLVLYGALIYLVYLLKTKYATKYERNSQNVEPESSSSTSANDGDMLINNGTEWIPSDPKINLKSKIGTNVGSPEGIIFGKKTYPGIADSILIGKYNSNAFKSIIIGNQCYSSKENGILIGNSASLTDEDKGVLIAINDGSTEKTLPFNYPADSYIPVKFNGEVIWIPTLKMPGDYYYEQVYKQNFPGLICLSKSGNEMLGSDENGIQRFVKVGGVFTPSGNILSVGNNIFIPFTNQDASIIILFEDDFVYHTYKFNSPNWTLIKTTTSPESRSYVSFSDEHIIFSTGTGKVYLDKFVDPNFDLFEYLPSPGYSAGSVSISPGFEKIGVVWKNNTPGQPQKISIYDIDFVEQTTSNLSILGDEDSYLTVGSKYIAHFYGEDTLEIRTIIWSPPLSIKTFSGGTIPTSMLFSPNGKLFSFASGTTFDVFTEDDWVSSRKIPTDYTGTVSYTITSLTDNGDFSYFTDSSNILEWKSI